MRKKLIISIFCILILLFVIGVVLKINTSNKNKDRDMKKIESTYKELEIKIKDYNSNRDKIVKTLDNYYTDNLEKDYNNFTKILNNQEAIIDKIKLDIEKLDKNCNNRLYSKSEINKICNNYSAYYETVYNLYINDYKEINKIIVSYNENSNKKLDEYKSIKIEDYLDYNKDGKYLGKD